MRPRAKKLQKRTGEHCAAFTSLHIKASKYRGLEEIVQVEVAGKSAPVEI